MTTEPATDEEIAAIKETLRLRADDFAVTEIGRLIARIDKDRRDFIDTVLPIAKAVGLSDPHDPSNPGTDWDGPFGALCAARIDALRERSEKAEALLNAPELHDFAKGAVLEAGHQRMRHGADHDAGKTPWDWFWLIGYLAQKAATAHANGDIEKALHHTISTAAAMNNWHAHIMGASSLMRPGVDPKERGYEHV